MNLDSFKNLFGDWFPLMEPFLKTDEFKNIMNNLKERSSRGKVIFPYSSTLKQKCPEWNSKNIIFKAFEAISINKLNTILIGTAPYYTIRNNKPIGDGLAFSTSDNKLPIALESFYLSIEKDIYNGLNLNMEKQGNLQFLCNQGVMLLNCSLTCEPGMPLIHFDLWKPFMKYFFKMINETFSNLNLVFIGEETFEYTKLISEQKENFFLFPNQHYIYKVENSLYNLKTVENIEELNIFSKINERLAQTDGFIPISWDYSEIKNVPF
jgi:uracil DNA glycosylase